MSRKVFSALLALGAIFLTGCSGHPAAGKWVAEERMGALFSSISVDFDGKAAIHPTDKQLPTRNCYWQAASADSINIQCGTAKQEEGKIFYSLEVTDSSLADLKQDGKVLGKFRRKS